MLTRLSLSSFISLQIQFLLLPVLYSWLGQTLSLSNSISHLGHILTYNLSDDDICAISKDMCRKANCLLHTCSCCDPFVKTRLFSSFCLSLYGASLWRSSSPQLRALDVSFNNILCKIWSLPRHSHTGIVHSVARLESIYNIVVIRSRSLLASARGSKCALISDLFSECAQSAYTALGYNNLFGGKHLKCYTVDDERRIVPGALLKLLVKDKLPHNRENAKKWQLKPPRR